MAASMLSVGIDIGTSTTSMVVSRLYVENTASCFAVPHVVITKKEIIYSGYIFQTPLDCGEMKIIGVALTLISSAAQQISQYFIMVNLRAKAVMTSAAA